MSDHDPKNKISQHTEEMLVDALKRDEALPNEEHVENAKERLLRKTMASGSHHTKNSGGLGVFFERLNGAFSFKPVVPMAAFACLAILMVSIFVSTGQKVFDDPRSFDVATAPEQWVAYEAAAQSDEMHIMFDSLMLDDLDDVFL